MRIPLMAANVLLGLAALFWRRLDDALLRWTLPPRPLPWRFLALLTAMGTALLAVASRPPAFDGRIHCHLRAQARLEERLRLEATRPAPIDFGR